ncbi:uncharacterized protein FIBRA_01029 [Fibroporia radiculosa]|uniref:Uncharacterized protein n=1 Tax=Fibroporia radiculosa TaxID=599839 RepID=J4GJ57_9APHY|nr:uncharacterized protein FIBRA_01029 [Fibroporia radiculosa]CCL99020.1 predicted protein [Fibroporia radiculosa]
MPPRTPNMAISPISAYTRPHWLPPALMSDPRFARFKTDPRFRRVKKEQSKVTVDERFKGLFEQQKKKGKKGKGQVDKFGRPLADTHEQDDLRRFYRLEDDQDVPEPEPSAAPDYARGAVLLESSDEGDDQDNEDPQDNDSDADGIITLGRDVSKPILVLPEEEAEIDLDEDTFAELDAQAAAYARENPIEPSPSVPDAQRTRRLAVVNLDWDHVRAIHLYKIFSSLVSPTGTTAISSSNVIASARKIKLGGATAQVVRGQVLSVRVYPSEFGKKRMAREDKEGPPPELFRNKGEIEDEEEINERTIFDVGEGEDYDEDMLRKYQLERLRYYYAIVECDSVEAASHIYSELEGTELERSANVFDLSFVPEDMSFDDECRDEATGDLSVPYKALDFRTDALRHSKVKLTWDEEDPERAQVTRRSLSRKEIEENDFRAYIASSSEDEIQPAQDKGASHSSASRDKLRALLLSGGDDLPEGWGTGKSDEDGVDMEITFTPGLSAANDDRDETTLEKYQRKMREKKKKRKDDLKKDTAEADPKASSQDEFFVAGSEDDGTGTRQNHDKAKLGKHKKEKSEKDKADESKTRPLATSEELAFVASNTTTSEPVHFNMKAVLKAEKKLKLKKGKKKSVDDENELQQDFSIDVKDERFKAVHEDHAFAIDPSNPHYKKTKSMSALLEERTRRQKDKRSKPPGASAIDSGDHASNELQGLVERIKRKSTALEQAGSGKRRKI